jgi:hypothetical protein
MNKSDRIISIIALIMVIPISFAATVYYHRYGPSGLNIFLGGLVTLAVYSTLYRENPIYRFVEHIYLGLAAGYGVVIIWSEVLSAQWYDPIFVQHQWLWLWILPLAIMAYFIFSRKYSWISRIPLVILSGFSAGTIFQGFVSQYFPQIQDSFKSIRPTIYTLSNPNPTPSAHMLSISGAINNALFLITLLSVMTYFFFSFEQKSKPVKSFARLGRSLMMIGFGAIFGSTIMTRFALLVDRMYFILIEWLHLGHPSF